MRHSFFIFWLMLPVTITLLWAAPAQSGAWPREPGSLFLSFGSSIDMAYDDPTAPASNFHSLYAEYGLRPKVTLGFDGGIDDGGDYTAILFLRRPMLERSQHQRFAFQAGVGVNETAGQPDYSLQGGLSWGKGITTRFGPGWMALDSTVEYRKMAEELVTKADFTIGITARPRTKLMLQIQSGAYPGSDPFVKLAPSIARQIADGKHIVLEAHVGVLGNATAGVKLGTWLEF